MKGGLFVFMESKPNYNREEKHNANTETSYINGTCSTHGSIRTSVHGLCCIG